MTRDETGQMVALVVLALACVLLACGSDPKPKPVRIDVVRRACIADRPPTHAPIDTVALFADPCEADCIVARVELGHYLRAVQRYARDAFTLCGPEPAEPQGD